MKLHSLYVLTEKNKKRWTIFQVKLSLLHCYLFIALYVLSEKQDDTRVLREEWNRIYNIWLHVWGENIIFLIQINRCYAGRTNPDRTLLPTHPATWSGCLQLLENCVWLGWAGSLDERRILKWKVGRQPRETLSTLVLFCFKSFFVFLVKFYIRVNLVGKIVLSHVWLLKSYGL